jgi:hypothetical protein
VSSAGNLKSGLDAHGERLPVSGQRIGLGFGCLEHQDRGGHNEGVLKRVVMQVIKMAMVLAVVVFVITPVYMHGQFILLIGSIALFLICLFLLKNLDGENSPWWPEKPRH